MRNQQESGAIRISQGPDRKLQFLKPILYIQKPNLIKNDFSITYGLHIPSTGQLLILRIFPLGEIWKPISSLLKIHISTFQR